MKRKNDVTIDEVLDAIMLQESSSSHEALVEWCKKYPEFKQEIADFFAAWATEKVAENKTVVDEDLVASRMVSHAMNLIHQQTTQNVQLEGEPVRLFKLINSSDKSEETLMSDCNLDDSLLSKLDRHLIIFSSIPQTCIRNLSLALRVAQEVVARALEGGPVTLAAHKAKVKPVSVQESFLDAVAASDLSDEQKREWTAIVQTESPK